MTTMLMVVIVVVVVMKKDDVEYNEHKKWINNEDVDRLVRDIWWQPECKVVK